MSSRSKKILDLVLNTELDAQIHSGASQEHSSRINIISDIIIQPSLDDQLSSLETTSSSFPEKHYQNASVVNADQAPQVGETEKSNYIVQQTGPYSAKHIKAKSEYQKDSKPAEDPSKSKQKDKIGTSNECLEQPGPSHCYVEQIEAECEYERDADPFGDSSSSYQPSDEYDESDYEIGSDLSKSRKRKLPKLAELENKTSEDKRKKKRNRKANRENWQRTINKNLRTRGQKYISRSGKEIPDKHPREINCTRCRYKCQENISEDQREIICQEYYSLADYNRQKMFIASHMQNVSVARKKTSPKTKNRETSRVYFLQTTDGVRHRVCRKFFCATLAISHRITETCTKGISSTGVYTGYDKRRDTIPFNATSDAMKQLVKEHIDSFPRIESHYCRRDSSKLYLSPDLNLSIMYRMYKEFCIQREINMVSEFVYKKIFHGYEPRLAFYLPKKDQCYQCNAYNSATDKTMLQEEYEAHKRRENEAMKMKEEDKIKAASEKGKIFRSISFDLQAVLSVPHAGDSQIYYKHKLNVYNFTIYDASNSDGHCFVWDETHGNKGSTEIGTCLIKYLMNLPETVTHVASFCDTCSGQNRNKFVAAAMLFAVNKIKHLKTIDMKFMESGHSYLEADSMHATIERAKRHKKIYSTREWGLLISMARIKPRPYFVNDLKYMDFFNLQQLVTDIVVNTTQNTQQEKVTWLNIKWMRFQKEKPFIIQYKYNLSDEKFHEIDVSNKRKPGKKKSWETVTLNQKYDSRLPVSQKKKKDLLSLLSNKIIPEDYTNFIKEIPETNNETQLGAAKLDE